MIIKIEDIAKILKLKFKIYNLFYSLIKFEPSK